MKQLFSFLLCGAILVSLSACDSNELNHEISDGEKLIGTHEGHEYVDLGLPSGILWATCNVGAINPEDYGDYFAWGETTPKEVYSWETYEYGSYDQLTKYCTDSRDGYDGFMDNKTVLEASDDAATVNWGGKWRMPTSAEQEELLTECIWTWTTLNGVNGYKVSSKAEGNTAHIFLPAAGKINNSYFSSEGSDGNYWSSSLSERATWHAYYLHSYEGRPCMSSFLRCEGLSVRPVCGSGSSSGGTVETYTVTLDVNDWNMGYVSGDGNYQQGEEVTISATAYSGYQFSHWSDYNTETPRDIIVTKDITLTAIFEEQDNSNLNGYENGYAYVDLGLPSGILWATCNIGATYSEDYGDYFAWGETTTKSYYDWSTYKYCNSNYELTKYCTSSSYGTVDYETTLESQDDVAYSKWRGRWRMPTLSEYNELIRECSWTWKGSGYLIKGTNGNSIFLPAAGYRSVSSLDNSGSIGYYWSSLLYDNYPNHAYHLSVSNGSRGAGTSHRCMGFSVRAVCTPR